MPRDDYEKLYDLWKQGALGEHYSLVSYRDRTSINSYCKLVDTRTRAVESFLDESAGTLGLWVDIFPLERVDITDPARPSRRKEGTSPRVVEVYRRIQPPLRHLCAAPRRQVHALPDHLLRRPVRDLPQAGRHGPGLPSLHGVQRGQRTLRPALDDVMDRNIIRQPELFPTRVASFEGREFAIPAQAEKLLRDYYGNWQEIPPEDQRPPAHVRSVEWVGEQPYAG